MAAASSSSPPVSSFKAVEPVHDRHVEVGENEPIPAPGEQLERLLTVVEGGVVGVGAGGLSKVRTTWLSPLAVALSSIGRGNTVLPVNESVLA